ncbi:MAG: undecaprenyl-diphosphate phosphatase [bacterium]
MNWLDAALLGLVQGASEFLPISSSGHLVIAQGLMGVDGTNIYLEVALHLGTLLAVVAYFRRDLLDLIGGTLGYLLGKREAENTAQFKLCILLILGTIPVAIGGLLLKDFFESAFEAPQLTGVMLLVTAAVLLGTRFVKTPNGGLSPLKALLIGAAQLVSVMPGISRSGSTIAAALYLKVEPLRAARFSFLLSIPAVTAAFVLKLKDFLEHPVAVSELTSYAVGAVVAFTVGMIALHYLLRLIASHRFHLFGWWCLAAGVFTIVYFK